MDLTLEGKTLFRKRVDALVQNEMHRTNFYYLLEQIDKRDNQIDELVKFLNKIIEVGFLTNEEKILYQEKLKNILNLESWNQ